MLNFHKFHKPVRNTIHLNNSKKTLSISGTANRRIIAQCFLLLFDIQDGLIYRVYREKREMRPGKTVTIPLIMIIGIIVFLPCAI